jgi:hypothetical protein
LQLFEKVHIYTVDGKGVLESVAHTSIDFETCSTGVEFGFGALRKGEDGGGVVALVGPTDEVFLKAESTECFSAACDERDDSMF